MSVQNFEKAATAQLSYTNPEQRDFFFYFVRLDQNIAHAPDALSTFQDKWNDLPKFSFKKKNLVGILFGVAEAWKQHPRVFGEDFPDWMRDNFQIWEDLYLNNSEHAKPGHIIDVLQSCQAIDVEPSEDLWLNLEDNALKKEPDFSPSFTADYLVAAEYFQRMPAPEIFALTDRRAIELMYNFFTPNIIKFINSNAGLGRVPPQPVLDALEKRTAGTISHFHDNAIITGLWTGAMYEALSGGTRGLSQKTKTLFRNSLPHNIEKIRGVHWREMHHASLWFGFETPAQIIQAETSKKRDVWEGALRHECKEAFGRGGLRSNSRVIPLLKDESIFSCITPNDTTVYVETDDAGNFNWTSDGRKTFNGHTTSIMRLSEKLHPNSVFLRMPQEVYERSEKEKSKEHRIQGMRAMLFEAGKQKPGTYKIAPHSPIHPRYALHAI